MHAYGIHSINCSLSGIMNIWNTLMKQAQSTEQRKIGTEGQSSRNTLENNSQCFTAKSQKTRDF